MQISEQVKQILTLAYSVGGTPELGEIMAEGQGVGVEYSNVVYKFEAKHTLFLGYYQEIFYSCGLKIYNLKFHYYDIILSYLSSVPFEIKLINYYKNNETKDVYKACERLKNKLKSKLKYAKMRVFWGCYNTQYFDIE